MNDNSTRNWCWNTYQCIHSSSFKMMGLLGSLFTSHVHQFWQYKSINIHIIMILPIKYYLPSKKQYNKISTTKFATPYEHVLEEMKQDHLHNGLMILLCYTNIPLRETFILIPYLLRNPPHFNHRVNSLLHFIEQFLCNPSRVST